MSYIFEKLDTGFVRITDSTNPNEPFFCAQIMKAFANVGVSGNVFIGNYNSPDPPPLSEQYMNIHYTEIDDVNCSPILTITDQASAISELNSKIFEITGTPSELPIGGNVVDLKKEQVVGDVSYWLDLSNRLGEMHAGGGAYRNTKLYRRRLRIQYTGATVNFNAGETKVLNHPLPPEFNTSPKIEDVVSVKIHDAKNGFFPQRFRVLDTGGVKSLNGTWTYGSDSLIPVPVTSSDYFVAEILYVKEDV